MEHYASRFAETQLLRVYLAGQVIPHFYGACFHTNLSQDPNLIQLNAVINFTPLFINTNFNKK